MPFKNFDEMLNNIKRLTGARNQKEVAASLGISGSAITDAKNRNVIPETWFQIIEEKFGVNKEALIQQAKNEYNSAHPHAQGSIAAPLEWVPFTPANNKHSEDAEIPNSEMMYMTSVVLESRTVYRSALASNIRAFYQAVKGEQEMDNLRDEVKKMREELSEMKEIILAQNNPEKKRAGNDR